MRGNFRHVLRKPAVFVMAGLFGALLVGLQSSGRADDEEPLEVAVRVLGFEGRHDAPRHLVVHLRWREPKVISGRVAFAFRRDGPVELFRSHEIGLSPGDNFVRVTLPPVDDSFDTTATFVTFRSGDREFDLGLHVLAASGTPNTRIVAICEGDVVRQEEKDELLMSLNADRFSSGSTAAFRRRRGGFPQALQRSLILPAHLDTEDLSVRAIDYCPFNVVVVRGLGFSLLVEEQLNAIEEWVRAGGSLLILSHGTTAPGTFGEYHARFVNRLLGAATTSARVALGRAGRLTSAGEFPEEGFAAVPVGLGYVVVDLRLPTVGGFSSRSWDRAVANLWRLPSAEVESVFLNGYYRPNARTTRLSPVVSLHDLLSDVGQLDLISPLAIVALLAVLAALVGPIDYIVLGKLGRRGATWITLPVICVVATALMMFQFSAQMSQNTGDRRLVITDRTPGGDVLRQDELISIFRGSAQTLEFEESGKLLTAVTDDVSPTQPIYEGRYPSGYTVELRVQQWTPRFIRRFAIGRAANLRTPRELDVLNWDGLAEDPTALRDASSFRRVFFCSQRPPVFCRVVNAHGSFTVGESYSLAEGFANELERVNVFGTPNWRVSPSGDPRLRDLPIFDHTDADQCLVIAATTVDETTYVSRCIYRGELP